MQVLLITLCVRLENAYSRPLLGFWELLGVLIILTLKMGSHINKIHKYHQILFVVGQNANKINLRWRTAAISKTVK